MRHMSPRLRAALGGVATLGTIAGVLYYEIVSTRPVRDAVHTCTQLLSLANRTDLEADERLQRARPLCTTHYLQTHPLAAAREGGFVGLPRNMHKNFKAWRQGDGVWISPLDRVGPVYQFLREDGRWRFDGPVGIIDRDGQFVPSEILVDDPPR